MQVPSVPQWAEYSAGVGAGAVGGTFLLRGGHASMGQLGRQPIEVFTPSRLGFHLAWLMGGSPDLLADLDPVCIACSQRAVHRCRGWDGVSGTARDRPRGGVWQAPPARHHRAVGSRDPSHVRKCGRFVRRIRVQYRSQPPDIRCQPYTVVFLMN